MKMKRTRVIGAGGSGKSYFLARNLINLEKIEENFKFLVLSYTHTGKNEIINHYRKLKGKKEVKYNKNTNNSRTFHSFVYYLINEATKMKRNLLDFLDEKSKTLLLNSLRNVLSIKEDLEVFNETFEALKKDLDLKEERKEKLWKLYKLGQEEEFVYFNKLKRLTFGEKIFLTLLKEPLLFDKGEIIDPFTGKKIASKKEYIRDKYEALTDQIFPLKTLEYYIERLEEKGKFIPINPIYLIYLLWKKKDLFKEVIAKTGIYYDLLIIDEAQDFPTLAIDFIEYLGITKRIVMAGDPYQAIYFDLGYNSYFPNKDYFNKHFKMPCIYRYSQEYLDFLKKQFKEIPETLLDVVSKSESKTEFEKRSKTFFNFQTLVNNTSKVLITNNIKQLKNREKYTIFCPYYKVVSPNNEKERFSIVGSYLIDVFLNDKRNEKFFLDKYEKIIFYTLQDINELKKFIWFFNKDFLKEVENLETTKEILESIKQHILDFFRKHHDYIFYLTTHRAKGKTIAEELYYYENYGLYINLIKKNDKYYFIHDMLKYVALTRPKNKIIYVV